MSTNAIQWNPTGVNQESDTAYLADAQRAGGATDPSLFASALANKLFYQVSTYMTALAQSLANKGYVLSDANLAALTSVFSNVLTNADIRGPLQVLSYSSAQTINVGLYTGFEITLGASSTVLTVSGQRAGDTVMFIFLQDATGGRVVTWPANFHGFGQPDPTANSLSLIIARVAADLSFTASAPFMDTTGINSTPIGATVPATGNFTTAASTDNSTKAATTAWAKFGLSLSLGANGYIALPAWLGGLILQWGTVSGLNDNSPTTVGFNINFPASCFGIIANDNDSTHIGGNPRTIGTQVISTSQFYLTAGGSGASAFWLAIGN